MEPGSQRVDGLPTIVHCTSQSAIRDLCACAIFY
jgi:hypothetical protein